MKTILQLFLILPVAAASMLPAGCASSKIDIKVDIYKKGLSPIEYPSSAEAESMREAVQAAETVFKEMPEKMDGYTKTLLVVYAKRIEYLEKLVGQDQPSKSDSPIMSGLEADRSNYLRNLKAQCLGGEKLAAVATTDLNAYLAAVDGHPANANGWVSDKMADLLRAVQVSSREVKRQLRLVSSRGLGVGDDKDSFLGQLEAVLKQGPGELNLALARAPLTASNEAKNAGRELTQAVTAAARLRDDLDKPTRKASVALHPLAEQVTDQIDPRTAVSLAASLSAAPGIKGRREEIDTDLTYAVSGDKLARRATEFDLYNSQIDRIQDPSDPVWSTIISAPETDWASQPFAHSFNYAEGKSSVVIVRDRLGQFRVQRARNDPSALIAAQLDISGSIASAATQVLAATTGAAPLAAKLTPTPGGPGTPPDKDAQTLSALQAEAGITARTAARKKARDAIQTSLERIQGDLKQLSDKEDDKAKVAELVRQAKVQLAAIKPLLDQPADNKTGAKTDTNP